MDSVDLIGLSVSITYFVFLIAEKLWPARQFPERKGRRWIGSGFLLLISTISVVVPLLIPEPWLDAHRWMDGTRLGIVGGTLVGIVILEGLIYAWHRTEHKVGFMGRAFHQIHHGSQRVDVPGSVLFHLLQMIVQVLLQLLVTGSCSVWSRSPLRWSFNWSLSWATSSTGTCAPRVGSAT